MDISIICPVYKKELYLHQCVDSVLNQTFTNWELILIDDESPDNCPIICDEYAKRDGRIKVIHQKNKGHSESRNVGIRVAQGNYLMFIDADDFLTDPNVLSELYNHTLNNNLDVCMSGISTLGFDGKIIESTFKRLDIPYNELSGVEILCEMIKKQHYHATMCSRLFKSSLIYDNNLLFKHLICDDEEWTPQVFYHASRIGFLDKDCYVIRKLNDSVTGSRDINTYKRKINDKCVTATMLMELFSNMELTREQKNILFDKFFSFFQMALYSYLKDLGDKPDKQLKAFLLEQYNKIKKYRSFLRPKSKLKLVAIKCVLAF